MVSSLISSGFFLRKSWLLLVLIILCCPAFSKANACGDVNLDGNIDVGDAVMMINIVFKFLPLPDPPESGDVNHDGSTNIGDIVYLINYAFKGGPAPDCPFYIGGVEHSPCKDNSMAVSVGQECVQWEYDGMGTLSLHRVDVALNCCPGTILVVTETRNDSLIITEYEFYDTGGPCTCLCLFDLDYDIVSLPEGEYTVVFPSQYPGSGYNSVSFQVVIGDQPSNGETCEPRPDYPW